MWGEGDLFRQTAERDQLLGKEKQFLGPPFIPELLGRLTKVDTPPPWETCKKAMSKKKVFGRHGMRRVKAHRSLGYRASEPG